MIGLVSSTIYPLNCGGNGQKPTWISPTQRLQQTRETVDSLLRLGLEDIHIADNSGTLWEGGTEEVLRPAIVHVYDHHQFGNKGISELWLLLSVLKEIATDAPVLKISGRYILKKRLDFDDPRSQLAGRLFKKGPFNYSLSTRCYLVRDKSIYETFLRRTLTEVYGYTSRIVGPRSLWRVVRNSLVPKYDHYAYDDPMWGIEHAAARAICKYDYRFENKSELGLEGLLGGSENVTIRE